MEKERCIKIFNEFLEKIKMLFCTSDFVKISKIYAFLMRNNVFNIKKLSNFIVLKVIAV